MIARQVHQEGCKSSHAITDYDTGEVACGSCGVVLYEKAVDSGPEPAGSREDYQANSRVGRKISLKMADMGLSTVIESKDRDASGRMLSGENRRMFYRLRMWDRNSRYASSSKSFQKAFTLLDGIASKLALPESVVEETAYMFRKIRAKKILAGRSTSGILCAAAYIVCRMTDTPRTLQDVADAGDVKRKSLQRTYRFLVRELGIQPQTYRPSEFVTRIAQAAGISEGTERQAFEILGIAEKRGISTSKNPVAMAAASIYLASVQRGEGISQSKIASTSGVSTVTIRDRTKEIRGIVPDEYV